MPYIEPHRRKAIDPLLEPLLKEVHELPPGELNYIVTKIMINAMPSYTRYTAINELIGVLECAKLEFFRRVAVDHEEGVRWYNGDVYERR